MWYDEIKKQFTSVIQYSQSPWLRYYPTLNFDGLFEKWDVNKKVIRSRMPFFINGNLVYEYPKKVSFGLDDNTKRERLDRFVRELWDFPLLQDFLRANKANFFENRVVEDYQAPNGTARRGMKIIKSFKLFFANDNDNLKRLQDEASAIMNEDKIEGTFCVSIHPLDYISISDNDHNWHSCHSMDSDYRTGNLNYMADKHTVVCYIKTGENRQINNFPEEVPWNSKKWRVLLYFDRECNFVMASKQYPLQSQEALDFFQTAWRQAHYEYIGESGIIHQFSPWHKDQIDSVVIDGRRYRFEYPVIPIGGQMAPIHKIYTPGRNSLQYNDILKNDTYKKEVRYAYLTSNSSWAYFDNVGILYEDLNDSRTSRYLFTENKLPLIEAGEEIYCPHCGLDIVSTADAILCDHCVIKYYDHTYLDEDYYPTCSDCGERYIHYEGMWVEGRNVCPHCAQYAETHENTDDKKKEK